MYSPCSSITETRSPSGVNLAAMKVTPYDKLPKYTISLAVVNFFLSGAEIPYLGRTNHDGRGWPMGFVRLPAEWKRIQELRQRRDSLVCELESQGVHPTEALRRANDVLKSEWRQCPPSREEQQDAQLRELVRKARERGRWVTLTASERRRHRRQARRRP